VTSQNEQNEEKRQVSLEVKSAALRSYNSALLVWRYVLGSLALDLMIFSFGISSFLFADLSQEQATTNFKIMLLLALLGILAISKDRLIDALGTFRKARFKTAGFLQRYSVPVMILIALIILTDSLFRIDAFNLVSILVSLIIAVGAAVSIYHSFKESNASSLELSKNRLLLMQQINQQIYLLHIIPMFLTRGISLLAALTFIPGDGQAHMFALGFTASLVLLLALMPQQEQFVTTCRSCTSWISRALKEFDSCPLCAYADFKEKKEEPEIEVTEKPQPARLEALKDIKDKIRKRFSKQSENKVKKPTF